MEMYQDEVKVLILPDEATCKADEEKRSPLDITECPLGYEYCTGNCYYYSEEI